MLQTIELFFILSSWSLVTTFLFPAKKKPRINHLQSWVFWKAIKKQSYVTVPKSARFQVGITSACDDDINLTNDLIQLDHPESIHAEKQGRRSGSIFA